MADAASTAAEPLLEARCESSGCLAAPSVRPTPVAGRPRGGRTSTGPRKLLRRLTPAGRRSDDAVDCATEVVEAVAADRPDLESKIEDDTAASYRRAARAVAQFIVSWAPPIALLWTLQPSRGRSWVVQRLFRFLAPHGPWTSYVLQCPLPRWQNGVRPNTELNSRVQII